VKILLKLGSDPNYTGGVNDRPLHIAAGKPHLGIVKLLLEAGIFVYAFYTYLLLVFL
jgi:ankyrin repeat protein